MKHAEYVAAYANQTPAKSKITISICLDTGGDSNILANYGPGVGWLAVYGSLTEHQRSEMLQHLNQYAELLVRECEADIKYRDEWDKYQK